MNPDDRSRKRLKALFDEDTTLPQGSTLDERAVQRIVAMSVREVRATQAKRRAMFVAGPTLAAAAAALLYASPNAIHVATDAPRCQSRAAAETLESHAATASRHEVGDLARIDATAGTVFAVRSEGGCSTEVSLSEGSVAVWARDLAGGELAVRTSLAEVTVHGTTFEVRSDADSTYVAVDEGRVEVRHAGGRTFLGAGEALEVRRSGAERERVDAPAHLRLDAVHGAAPAVDVATVDSAPASSEAPAAAPAVEPAADVAPVAGTPTAPTTRVDASTTLAAAELAYREGRLDEARRLFRQVGAQRGGTAEAALIRLGRLEMRSGHASEAASALAEHRRRFPNGSLAAEARMAEAQARRSLGDVGLAQTLEGWILAERPDSPQANTLRSRNAPR